VNQSTYLTVGVILAAMVQALFGYTVRSVAPPWSVLPPTPSPLALEASSFGDRQLLYRELVLDLQNFGDTGGHVTRMADYDLVHVVEWLKVLDTLDPDANHHLKLAAQYFAQTQNPSTLDPLISYIQQAVALSPARRWRWLLHAIYLAQAKRQNLPWAAALAAQLSAINAPDMPIVARQMGAFLQARAGNYRAAGTIMDRVLAAHGKEVSPSEAEYMAAYRDFMWRRASGDAVGARTPLPPGPPITLPKR
jgi:hypothetical protein